MARCVERSNVFCPGMSQPTPPKIRVDTRFSEDCGVEELFSIFSVPPIGFGRSTKAIGVREKVWKKMRECRGGRKGPFLKRSFLPPLRPSFLFSQALSSSPRRILAGGAGAGAEMFFEEAVELGEGGEAGLGGDLDDLLVGIAEEGDGGGEAVGVDVFKGEHADMAAEEAAEGGGAHIAAGGEVGDGEGGGVMVGDMG